MQFDFDLIVIGLGPAGMAVSIMGSEMGLKVAGIEKNKIGGECMNVGCIPSKAILRYAKRADIFSKVTSAPFPIDPNLFSSIQKDLTYIGEVKTKKMFEKVTLFLGEKASFINAHQIQVGDKIISGKRIFIATGTKPLIPPIEGLSSLPYLTNENIFSLSEVPKSLTIIGGGAIGTEMAQAFRRLGSEVSIVHKDEQLLPFGDSAPGHLLEEQFKKEGIRVLNGRLLQKASLNSDQKIELQTDKGEILVSEKILVAAGRVPTINQLGLENAKVVYSSKGITVNSALQTSQKHIYAVGDCNGHYLLSHAAMHQGMIALMNTMIPTLFKMNFKKFVVPWTVFTEPQISHVGMRESDLKKSKLNYKAFEAKYEDYGAAIAEKIPTGFVRVYASPLGKIYGVSIVGEGSGEMINEWALAIQKGVRLHEIMMLQHSFPTMGFLSKRVSEIWMMDHMKSSWIKRMIRMMF